MKADGLAVSELGERISGPMLDRIDLFAEVPRVDYEKLVGEAVPEASALIWERVGEDRRTQRLRFGVDGPSSNVAMTPRLVRAHCQERLQDKGAALLKVAMSQLSLSARALHRVLKVARTIADLDHANLIRPEHVAESIQYRRCNAPN